MDFSIRLKPKTIFIILFVFSCCLITTALASMGGTYYYIDDNYNIEDKNSTDTNPTKEENSDTPEDIKEEEIVEEAPKTQEYKNTKYGYSIDLNEGFVVLEPVGADSATNPSKASETSKIALITEEKSSSLNFLISIKDLGIFEGRDELFAQSIQNKSEKNCYREDATATLNSITKIKIVDEFVNCDNNKQNRYYFVYNEETGRGIEIASFYSKGFTSDIDEMLETFKLI